MAQLVSFLTDSSLMAFNLTSSSIAVVPIPESVMDSALGSWLTWDTKSFHPGTRGHRGVLNLHPNLPLPLGLWQTQLPQQLSFCPLSDLGIPAVPAPSLNPFQLVCPASQFQLCSSVQQTSYFPQFNAHP